MFKPTSLVIFWSETQMKVETPKKPAEFEPVSSLEESQSSAEVLEGVKKAWTNLEEF